MGDDLGIGVCTEAMPAFLQFGAGFRVVKQLAVVDDADAAILVEDRLPSIRQADNAQSPRRQTHLGPVKETILVGPAMGQGSSHGAHRTCRHWVSPCQINDSRNSTHWPASSARRVGDRFQEDSLQPGGRMLLMW